MRVEHPDQANREGGAGSDRAVGFEVVGVLGSDALVVTDRSVLGIRDPANFLLRERLDLGTPIGQVAVAATARCVAAIVGDEVIVFAVAAGR